MHGAEAQVYTIVQTDAGRVRAERLDGRPEGANADAEAQAAAIAMVRLKCIASLDPFPSPSTSDRGAKHCF